MESYKVSIYNSITKQKFENVSFSRSDQEDNFLINLIYASNGVGKSSLANILHSNYIDGAEVVNEFTGDASTIEIDDSYGIEESFKYDRMFAVDSFGLYKDKFIIAPDASKVMSLEKSREKLLQKLLDNYKDSKIFQSSILNVYKSNKIAEKELHPFNLKSLNKNHSNIIYDKLVTVYEKKIKDHNDYTIEELLEFGELLPNYFIDAIIDYNKIAKSEIDLIFSDISFKDNQFYYELLNYMSSNDELIDKICLMCGQTKLSKNIINSRIEEIKYKIANHEKQSKNKIDEIIEEFCSIKFNVKELQDIQTLIQTINARNKAQIINKINDILIQYDIDFIQENHTEIILDKIIKQINIGNEIHQIKTLNLELDSMRKLTKEKINDSVKNAFEENLINLGFRYSNNYNNLYETCSNNDEDDVNDANSSSNNGDDGASSNNHGGGSNNDDGGSNNDDVGPGNSDDEDNSNNEDSHNMIITIDESTGGLSLSVKGKEIEELYNDILSESEKTIISLSLFLAISNKNDKTLIIIDDPVDSHDTNNKWFIMNQITSYYKDSKVLLLIFTHDLSLSQSTNIITGINQHNYLLKFKSIEFISSNEPSLYFENIYDYIFKVGDEIKNEDNAGAYILPLAFMMRYLAKNQFKLFCDCSGEFRKTTRDCLFNNISNNFAHFNNSVNAIKLFKEVQSCIRLNNINKRNYMKNNMPNDELIIKLINDIGKEKQYDKEIRTILYALLIRITLEKKFLAGQTRNNRDTLSQMANKYKLINGENDLYKFYLKNKTIVNDFAHIESGTEILLAYEKTELKKRLKYLNDIII